MGDYFSSWLTSIDSYLATNDQNRALHVTGFNLFPLMFSYVEDVEIQARFSVASGSARLGIRQSAAGSYVASLSADGQVALYRGNTLLATSNVAVPTIGTWLTMRLSAIGNRIAISMDGVEILSTTDSTPLNYGTIYISSNDPTSDFFVDDLILWGTITQPLAETTPAPQSDSPAPLNSPSSLSDAPAAPARKIAFTRLAPSGDNYDIFTINPDGTGLSPLLDGSTSDYQPNWSPDGTKIAFNSNRNGGNEIWIYDLLANPSTQPTLVTEGSGPAWSPDGQYIAFARRTNPYTASETLMVIDLVTPTRPITTYPNTSPGAGVPRWSPDGSKIAIDRNGGSIPGPELNTGIYVVTLSTGVSQLFINRGFNPSWSPDGRKIAFERKEFVHTGDWKIHAMNLNQLSVQNVANRVVELISTRPGLNPDWSPDGSQIVAEGYVSGQGSVLFIVDAEGIHIDSILVATTGNSWQDWGPDYPFAGCPGYDPMSNSPMQDPAICQVFVTNTPRGIIFNTNTPQGPTFTPTATLTPTFTATPTLVPTLSWQQLEMLFPLPMAPTVNASARLSNGDFADRLNSGICSRDINPYLIQSANQPLIAPADAEVIIIDETTSTDPDFNNPNNANLGKFVAIRIFQNDLPEIIKSRIEQQYPDVDTSTGYLYIGYAHLNSVSVTIREQISQGGEIGLSGGTGDAGTGNEHLDISAFYIQEDIRLNPRPYNASYPGSPYSAAQMENWYNSFYLLYLNPRLLGSSQMIDPLVLWPNLLEGTIYDYSLVNSQSCPRP